MFNKERLTNGLTYLVVGCALLTTIASVKRAMAPRPPSRSSVVQGNTPGWRAYAQAGHVIGPATAPITVVEFADFECPFCASLADSIRALQTRNPGTIRLVFRHFPVRGHRFAIPAARATECADRVERFEQMHDFLFKYRDSLGLRPWTWFASLAGVADTVAFQRCMNDPAPIPALARDTADGRRLNVQGTPTLLINDLRVGGAPGGDLLVEYLRRYAPRLR
jgi:protein-disulfide isomerase